MCKGLDVYLFLTGMMLLSEVARREGLFDWLSAFAARRSGGSAKRLFLLVYGVGVIVTTFLSNDATAVVLTPAVVAVTRAARAENPLAYLFICAFIANAASFVLPISNPANLVLYASKTPALLTWLEHFALPAILSIVVTYVILRWTQREALTLTISDDINQSPLSAGGRTAAIGIAMTAIILLVASTLGLQLGLPTAIAGGLTTTIVLVIKREAPWPVLSGISWAVLPLVAGLFVLVQGLGHTGVITQLGDLLRRSVATNAPGTAWMAGIALAIMSNLMNNLPAGLVAANTILQSHPPVVVASALLVGVDLGPNLSITGSLATILWLTALRRENLEVSFLQFLKIGALVMPSALLVALASMILSR
ncbi:arsenic transporter [Acidiphilium multivorum]|uniref:arsenic transporter n=1 Tax=Acidiphilium multivorum TaxID=62140 RepID=UPI0039C9F9E3